MAPMLAAASFHKQRFPLSRQISVTIRSRMPDTKTHHPKWRHQAHGHKAVVMRSWNLSFQTSAARKSDPGCLHETGQTWESELGIIYWIWSRRTNISLPLKSEQVSDLYEADPALWNRSAEAKRNATELNSQHPSNVSIKEAKASQTELQKHGRWLTKVGLYCCRDFLSCLMAHLQLKCPIILSTTA